MDLLRLDKDTYLPDRLIESYSSLIWTERYLTAGEFELKTPRILETLTLLPENSLLTHRETSEVMLVESHEITKSPEGYKELTIKGHSLESFAERRIVEGPYPNKKYKMARLYTAAEGATVLLWNAFVNPSTNDVTRIGDGTRDVKDNIPNVVITDSTTVAGKSKRRWLTGGQIYAQILSMLRQDKLGVRCIRPASTGGRVVTVTTNDKGIISYTTPATSNKLRFDIYNGVNRTKKQDVEKAVVFHYGAKYLTDQSYLFSIADYDTLAFMVSGVGTRQLYRDRRNDAPLSGLDRRVIWIDAGEPGDPDFPKNATDKEKDDLRAQNKADFLDDLRDKADETLDAHDRVKLFDCKVDSTSPYQYQEHYFLGDRVSLIGEYGFDQTMFVVEHVRTEDNTGDVGYPVLSADMDDVTT